MTEGIKKRHQQTFGVIKGSLSGFGDGFTSVCIKAKLTVFLKCIHRITYISYSSKTFHKFKKKHENKIAQNQFSRKKSNCSL